MVVIIGFCLYVLRFMEIVYFFSREIVLNFVCKY